MLKTKSHVFILSDEASDELFIFDFKLQKSLFNLFRKFLAF
jgi:hypothetical protein